MISYEKDFYGWTQEQASALAAGRFGDLDIANLTEEIESMGKRERNELKSRYIQLFWHLLKWQFQPSHRGGSWANTIKLQRIEIQDAQDENPGLARLLPEIQAKAYRLARVKAAAETGLDEKIFPVEMPWGATQAEAVERAMTDGYFPE